MIWNPPHEAGPCRASSWLESAAMLKVFVIEDSAVIRENLIAALEELAPVRVVGTAENEHAAIAWLAANPQGCDLVLVDIFLSGGSGLGVLRSVAGFHKTPSFVVLTNFATPDMCRKCLELGAARVFDKSNEVDALMHYCARLARGETGLGELR